MSISKVSKLKSVLYESNDTRGGHDISHRSAGIELDTFQNDKKSGRDP